MYKFKRLDFVETDLKPKFVEACIHQVALLDSSSANFVRLRDRLQVVRELKRKLRSDVELRGL